MKNFLLTLTAVMLLFSCNQKKETDTKTITRVEKNEYTISNEGLGAMKVGMRDSELEKLLTQRFSFQTIVDSPGYWVDTIQAKYKDAEVSLIFERVNGDTDSTFMQLLGVETSSPLCKTEYGVGIGDDRAAILAPYDDHSIYMGPEYELINDTTWAMSKTKYSVSVRDDKWAHQLIFHLVNKKIVSLGVSFAMGE